MVVPEHDRRILESMAMKKQQELRDKEAAHRTHQQWEQERELRRQVCQPPSPCPEPAVERKTVEFDLVDLRFAVLRFPL